MQLPTQKLNKKKKKDSKLIPLYYIIYQPQNSPK